MIVCVRFSMQWAYKFKLDFLLCGTILFHRHFIISNENSIENALILHICSLIYLDAFITVKVSTYMVDVYVCYPLWVILFFIYRMKIPNGAESIQATFAQLSNGLILILILLALVILWLWCTMSRNSADEFNANQFEITHVRNTFSLEFLSNKGIQWNFCLLNRTHLLCRRLRFCFPKHIGT